jgi:hypothetical protein
MANLSCVPKFLKKEITDTWVAETWKLMLLDNTYTPSTSIQQYVSDAVAKEIVDANGVYVTGGIVINGKIAKEDPINTNNYFIDATDVVVGPNASVTYRYGIVYKVVDAGNHAVNPIRAQIDFYNPLDPNGNQIVVNGKSTIQWNVQGIIYVL